MEENETEEPKVDVKKFSITSWIIGANILMYLLTLSSSYAVLKYAISSDTMNHPLRWVTSMFVHGGFVHLLFNMLILYEVGTFVEEKYNTKTYLIMYFVGGFFGTLCQLVVTPPLIPLLGASGAVLSIFAVYAFHKPKAEFALFFIIPAKAKDIALYGIGISIALHILDIGIGIAHLAHAGGLAFGWIFVKDILPKLNLNTK